MANSVQQSQPNLASLLELFKGNLMMQLNCHQVGEIVSFDPTTQTAEVQIKMLKTHNGELQDYAILLDCPCIVLSGGKGRLTLPIEQGDSCLVLFNDRDIDNWYAGGQKMQPRTERMHSYSDAIALVGIRNLQNKIEDYLVHGTELKYGKSTIKLENNKVTITDHKDTITMDNGDITIENPNSTIFMDKSGDITINGNVNIIQNTVDDNSLHAYIISSYHSGQNWYRVYSDGWCEQGGYQTVSGSGATTNINFHKTFKDTNISIQCTQQGYTATAQANSGVSSWTTSSFVFTCGTIGNPSLFWEARGYVA